MLLYGPFVYITMVTMVNHVAIVCYCAAPPPPYVSEFDNVDLNGPEIQAADTRNSRGYHRLNHQTHRLFSGNLKFTSK